MKISPVEFVLKGVFDIVHKDAQGNLKEAFTVDNTITTVGKQRLVLKIQDSARAAFTRMALDASSTAAAAGNTTLASEITSPSLKRAAATASQATTNVASDTSQLVHTFTSTATQAVYGVGIFDTPTSGGNMISRATFSVKNLVSGDTLQVTHKIIVA